MSKASSPTAQPPTRPPEEVQERRGFGGTPGFVESASHRADPSCSAAARASGSGIVFQKSGGVPSEVGRSPPRVGSGADDVQRRVRCPTGARRRSGALRRKDEGWAPAARPRRSCYACDMPTLCPRST
eukprot:gene5253-biopygen7475